MIGKLVDMLPNSMKGFTATLIPPLTPPRVQVTASSFEYIPIVSLLPDSDTKTSFNTNYLCLIVCTTHAFEIWGMNNYKKFTLIYCKPESGLHSAHYIPLLPADTSTIPVYDNLRGHLNGNLPILAVAKQIEEYSSALGIHLYSLKNSKYFHVFRFTSELTDFVVSEHVIAASLKGGQVKVFNLQTLEQHSSIDTIFLSKEMHDLVISEDSNAELHTSVTGILKDIGTKCDITPHLIAYVRYDIVSESRFTTITKGIMKNKLINEYNFAKETAQKLFSLGDAGYNKMMNIFNTRKAKTIIRDHEDSAHFLTPNDNPVKGIEEELKEEKSLDINEDSEDEFIELSSDMAHKEVNSESENKVSVIVQRIVDSAVFCKISPKYFKGITIIKFSESGTLLLLGNENAQLFYIYKLFPETGYRHISNNQGKAAVLLYSIFRGYTSAKVSSVSFSLCEKWLIINSAKGTSHIYRLDENILNANTPIISNTSDNTKPILNTEVVNLSAFNKFKYSNHLIEGDTWPVTTILGNYPLDMLGTKKEVLLRMGAIFYKQIITPEEVRPCIPLFITITKRGTVFSNALLTFKSTENKSFEKSLTYEQKNYELLKHADKNFPNKDNYYNDKLVVENLAQFKLTFEYKGEKSKEFLDKNVISIKEDKKCKDRMRILKDIEEKNELQIEEQKEETFEKKQQRWLKEIMTIHFSKVIPSIRLSTQFRFYRKNGEKEGENIYERMFSREANYEAIEQYSKPEQNIVQSIKEEYIDTFPEDDDSPNEDSNPFADNESLNDKMLKKTITRAMNSTISRRSNDESDQKSKIFQKDINIIEDYKPNTKDNSIDDFN